MSDNKRPNLKVVQPTRTYVILPDQQIPWHDRELHEVVLRMLADVKPDGVVNSGDITDKPQFSLKYPWNHRMVDDPISSVKYHQRTARQVLREYVQAAGSEDNWIVEGNHDARFLSYVSARAPLLHAVEDEGGRPLISLDAYLDATNSGYQIATDPNGMAGYPASHIVLGKHLAVYHGWLLGNGKGGASAAAHLEYLQHSVIVGHTHRQAKVHKTLHTVNGDVVVLVGVEAGTLALVKGGLGHTVNPNWQQGLAIVTIFGDGEFTADTAVYANNSLFFPNGQRWTYSKRGVRYAA
jgi:predicted phosphodiesterase